MKKNCAIVLNGEIDAEITENFIICADGGASRLCGRKPDIVVGDFDSLRDVPKGIKTVRHAVEKNQTDGELCVDCAKEQGFSHIVFYGASGGRLDHVLGNLALLAYADARGIDAKIKQKDFDVYFAKNDFSLNTQAGDIISVVSFGGAAEFRGSKGLYYPLDGLKILPDAPGMGISNVALTEEVSFAVSKGAALVFHNRKHGSQ